MRSSRILLADAFINLPVGVFLAKCRRSIVELMGVPAEATFYPSILSAVLVEVGVALMI